MNETNTIESLAKAVDLARNAYIANPTRENYAACAKASGEHAKASKATTAHTQDDVSR